MHASFDILTLQAEAVDLEFKQAQGRNGNGEVPDSIWESYSAMANTNGGYILLGVEEKDDGTVKYLGLKDAEKVRTQFWNHINNPQTVNRNILKNDDVFISRHRDKEILVIHIPRAHYTERPICKGKDIFSGTYKRYHEGDYRCDETAVRRMLADASPEHTDSRVLEKFTFEDIDADSLASYRTEFRYAKPNIPWHGHSNEEFLKQLGAWRRDRQSGNEGLTVAGLLMLGKHRSILEAFPSYHVDYQENPHLSAAERWSDRVTNDGGWPGNLYEFYKRVYPRLIKDLKIPFHLEQSGQSSTRVDDTPVHKAIREAFVNALVHAEYSHSFGILIQKQPDCFLFRNPGTPRLPIPDIMTGKSPSYPRNPTLHQMFSLIGASERAGAGISTILDAWNQQNWRTPHLKEELQPYERTTLELGMLSLIADDTLHALYAIVGDIFDKLPKEEKIALATAYERKTINNAELSELANLHPRDATLTLGRLVNRGSLVPKGKGRGMSYVIGKKKEHSRIPDWDKLDAIAAPIRASKRTNKADIEATILELCKGRFLMNRELAELLDRGYSTIRSHYIAKMVNKGQLELQYPDDSTRSDQAYRTVESCEHDH